MDEDEQTIEVRLPSQIYHGRSSFWNKPEPDKFMCTSTLKRFARDNGISKITGTSPMTKTR
jgi:hypothetical protein